MSKTLEERLIDFLAEELEKREADFISKLKGSLAYDIDKAGKNALFYETESLENNESPFTNPDYNYWYGFLRGLNAIDHYINGTPTPPSQEDQHTELVHLMDDEDCDHFCASCPYRSLSDCYSHIAAERILKAGYRKCP